MGERNALLRGVITEVQIAQQLRRRPEVVVIEDHRQPGEGGEAFAADARSKVNTCKIDWYCADGTDAIEAELEVMFSGNAFKLSEVIQDAGGGFTVRGPHPPERLLANTPANFSVIERLAPTHLINIKMQPKARGVIDEAIAEFAVAQQNAPPIQQRNLASHRIIGQAAGTKQDFDPRGGREIAQQLFRGAKIARERIGAMRNGPALECLANFLVHLDRPRQITGENLLHHRRRRGQGLGHLDECLESEVHGLELRLARANHRAKSHKAQVFVEPKLAHGAGNDGEVKTAIAEILREKPNQARKNKSVAEFFLDGKQPH